MVYINKMIFVEAEYVECAFKEYGITFDNVVQCTDYGNYEITNDCITNLRHELKEYPDDFDYSLKSLDEALTEALGKDIYDKLLAGELDFVQVIYV